MKRSVFLLFSWGDGRQLGASPIEELISDRLFAFAGHTSRFRTHACAQFNDSQFYIQVTGYIATCLDLFEHTFMGHRASIDPSNVIRQWQRENISNLIPYNILRVRKLESIRDVFSQMSLTPSQFIKAFVCMHVEVLWSQFQIGSGCSRDLIFLQSHRCLFGTQIN